MSNALRPNSYSYSFCLHKNSLGYISYAVFTIAIPTTTGVNAARSVTWSCTPEHVSPANSENHGWKYASRNATPGKSNLRSSAAHSYASMYGAPFSSKGFVVPRPSDSSVPSRCTVAGNTAHVSIVGIFGEGKIHGRPVSSCHISRPHPVIFTTSSSHPIPECSLNSFAISPMVMPGRVGSSNCPTNDVNSFSVTLPST